MSAANVRVIKELLRRFNSGDYVGAFELIDPATEWHDPAGIPGGGVHIGHDGVRRWFARWLDAWEEFTAEPQKIIDAGDQVIVVERMTGTGRQSGLEVDQLVVASYTVRDGKVVKRLDYPSEEEALAAAGAG